MISLSTRLSFFFLTALAVVLVGFSTAIYFVAHNYLNHQLETRLIAIVDTLTAAAEIEPKGVQWEPDERRIFMTTDEPTAWIVVDDANRIIDGDGDDIIQQTLANSQYPEIDKPARIKNDDWLLCSRHLVAENGPDLTVCVAISQEVVHGTLQWLAWALIGFVHYRLDHLRDWRTLVCPTNPVSLYTRWPSKRIRSTPTI